MASPHSLHDISVEITLCPLFDADHNGHLDLRDFAALQNAVTNAGG